MFTKITEQDLANKGVMGLPDTPNLSTMEMQQKFDELAKEVVVPKFNNLVDELDEKDLDNVTHSEDITNFKLDSDGRMQVSTDGGETYGYAGSTGHQIMDGSGTRYPARANLQFSQNVSITDYDEENGNKTFLSVVGEKGDRGEGATIRVGTVESADTPSIENVGSLTDAIFNFKLPKGDEGNSATIQVGSVTKGENASVYNSGTSSQAIFNFVLPKGDKGDTGQGINILGEYETLEDLQTAHPTGQRGDAYMVGTENPKDLYAWDVDHNLWQNQGALQGAKGDTGASATISIGSVSEGQSMAVENVGTSTDAIFNFTLKKGDKGDQGDTGTISVGTVESGENASVTNVGTSTNAIFNFVIPRGEKGDQGSPTVINGKQGANVTLYGTDIYTSNDDGAYTVSQEISNLKAEIAENGGGSVVRVTFDEDQGGDSITFAIDGMNTITKVVPSVEPRMIEISTKEMGVMTITDTTISKSITLTIDTYELYSIPFASGFDFHEWLTLGNVTGTYASLEEVLADEKALRQLFNKHDSVDYLVECCESSLDADVETIVQTDLCAKWINLRDYALDTLYANQYIASAMDTADKYFYGEWVLKDNVWQAKGNVPIMTSDSAPYGQAICSTYYSSYNRNAFKAFDGDDTTPWETAQNDSNKYVGYHFVNPVNVRKVRIYVGSPFASSDLTDTTVSVVARNTSSDTWTTIKDNIALTKSGSIQEVETSFDNDNYYYEYAIKFASGNIANGSYSAICTLQFYGRELKVSVPKMTSNNAPWGEVSGNVSSGDAFRAFDGSDSTWAYPTNYIQYDFGYDVKFNLAYIDNTHGSSAQSGTAILKGSKDGSVWVKISDTDVAMRPNLPRTYLTPNSSNDAFRYLRFEFSANAIVEHIQFYGLDYSEHTERHWIYDHGVELEEISLHTNSGTLPFEKRSDCIYIQDNSTSQWCSMYCPKININDYDLIRAEIGKEYGASTAQICVDATEEKADSTAKRVIVDADLPYNPYLDTQLVTQECYPTIMPASGTTQQGYITVVSWWLE